MRVEFSPESQSDLEAIGDYIARDNPLRADSFLDEISDAALSLGQWPNRAPVSGVHPAVRRWVHGAYNIYFEVLSDRVRVLRILNAALPVTASMFGKPL